jgi:hypothetical protein
LNVDTIFGGLRHECLHQRVVRNTIFRKAPPSIVSGYGKQSINLNKVVATFEKHIFLSQTTAKYGIDIQIVRPEMTKFKMFREQVNMDFYFVGITF